MANAASAVGIAQTDRRMGSSTMLLEVRKPTISNTEPIATKMSSLKNTATLSVAAAMARMA